jgi:CheY-like chemotaxis protein
MRTDIRAVAEQRARILVVDDDDFLRAMLAAVLRSAGHDVAGEACDGIAAIHVAATLSPDLITMDLEMPRLSGVEATRRIVASRIAPVIVVSSSQCDDDRAAALAAGACRFVPKLDAPSQLPAAIDSVLAQEQLRMKIGNRQPPRE